MLRAPVFVCATNIPLRGVADRKGGGQKLEAFKVQNGKVFRFAGNTTEKQPAK